MRKLLMLLLTLLPALSSAQTIQVGATYLPCIALPVTVDSVKGTYAYYRVQSTNGGAVTSCRSTLTQFRSSFSIATQAPPIVVPPPVDTVRPPVVTPPPVTPPPTSPPTAPGANHMWENSAECDASDSNILMCDDFEDGVWYDRHCGNLGSGGLLAQDGWCGTIYNNTGLAAGTVRCNGAGFKSLCAATTGNIISDTGNMADITLREGVRELYVRFYTKPNSGYQFGAEKLLDFNHGVAGGGGIQYGGFSWNCGGTTRPTGRLTMGLPAPAAASGEDACVSVNQNLNQPFSFTGGNWYFIEIHYKLGEVFEVWADSCGPDGNSCPATPTLRMRYPGRDPGLPDFQNPVRVPPLSGLITVLWVSAWSNPESRGERYWDQFKVSKVGPIGFMR